MRSRMLVPQVIAAPLASIEVAAVEQHGPDTRGLSRSTLALGWHDSRHPCAIPVLLPAHGVPEVALLTVGWKLEQVAKECMVRDALPRH